MYKKILVPLDGSRRAEAIMPHVIEIAQNQDSTLVLLTVVEPFVSTLNPRLPRALDVDTYEKQSEIAQSYIENLMSDLTARGIKTTTAVEYGAIVSTITKAAEREDVDLVAIASHGRTGLSRALYGSTAAGLLYQVERPLLIVRAAGE